MSKASTISSIIGGISGVALLIFIITVYIPHSNERLAESTAKLEDARMKVDGFVNRAILLCADQSSGECDKLMIDWYNECQKSEMRDMPSCHDGRINKYLSRENLMNKQSSSESHITDEVFDRPTLNPNNDEYLKMMDERIQACQFTYEEYQKIELESSDIEWMNYVLSNYKKIDDCASDIEHFVGECQFRECNYAEISELRDNLTEAKDNMEYTLTSMRGYP
ncbi:hypothetical protein [Candidatus Nitrosotenuis cloacae]|uniref:hypothetical protein n=1 Tax=Candidatus Nitrosotenuis cloacae TaxID=1603555 RepID=UPI00227E7CAB|nr:hypothetical protein [Candidatus Nitrosotenuis cloacae]